MIRALFASLAWACVLLMRCGAAAEPGARCVSDADCGSLVCDVGRCARAAASGVHPSPAIATTARLEAPSRLDEVFRIPIGERIVASPILLPTGEVLVLGLGGHAVVLRADGTIARETRFEATFRSTPAAEVGGTTAIGAMDGVLRLVDSALVERARLDLGEPIEGPIVALPNGTFAVPTRGLAIVTSSGTVLSRIPTASRFRGGALALPDGGLVFATTEGELVLVGARGELRHRVAIGANADARPARLGDGSLVIGTDLAELVRVSPDGIVLGRTTTPFDVRATPLVRDDGSVIAVSLDGTVQILDGSLVASKSVRLPHRVSATPLLFPDGSTLVATLGGTLHGLDATLEPRLTVSIGAPIVTTPLPLRNGTLLVASDDGLVRGLR